MASPLIVQCPLAIGSFSIHSKPMVSRCNSDSVAPLVICHSQNIISCCGFEELEAGIGGLRVNVIEGLCHDGIRFVNHMSCGMVVCVLGLIVEK